ncbi:hypothetical protein DM02DRAFT_730378 [Periconia macrospinosa]|uniref:Uncharacterized protein n=1 Tax=Periconia macrospinosa TaxID=97972 RepID=A0A2V1DHM6_9PLEO|nr:hypothetical protein DM02DRAFT_730378 [Periconia macrospinosa]
MAPPLTYAPQESSRQRRLRTASTSSSRQSRREEEHQHSRSYLPHFIPHRLLGLERIRERTRIIGDTLHPDRPDSPDSSDWEYSRLKEKSSIMPTTRKQTASTSTPKKSPGAKITVTAKKRPLSRNSREKCPAKSRKRESCDTASSVVSNMVALMEGNKATNTISIKKEGQDDTVITSTWNRPVSISSEDEGSENDEVNEGEDADGKDTQSAAATMKITTLEKEIKTLKEQHAKEIAVLKAELEASRIKTETTQSAYEQEKKVSKSLQDNLSNTEVEIASSRRDREKLEETKELLQQESQKLRKQVTTLETALDDEREKNKSLLLRRSQQRESSLKPTTKPMATTTTTTTTKPDSQGFSFPITRKSDTQRSTFPTPLSPSPAITISSNNSDMETDQQRRMKTLQRNYMALKTEYDILSYWAGQISLAWKGMEYSPFGNFGHYVKELRGVLEKVEKKKMAKDEGSGEAS